MLLRVRSDPLVRSVVLPGPETLDSVVVDTPEQRWCTTRFSYGKPDSHPANVWLLRLGYTFLAVGAEIPKNLGSFSTTPLNALRIAGLKGVVRLLTLLREVFKHFSLGEGSGCATESGAQSVFLTHCEFRIEDESDSRPGNFWNGKIASTE
ncbi:hypothetical protein AXG93_3891s1180 [Marchantia polymorpha subsp. ruderalis]|uniref:Uncharacterized protein n=1 Tax=Marchantia polymorpha subsp. ruderalis TaxID=1480154 RepID=A0A176WNG7_MARPO|nr:hypothetical protein AXG93_3891s1180 [Marchantia polymorpha subsp. ruderalis]